MKADNSLELLKIQLGISSTIRDKYLETLLNSIETELLKVQNFKIDKERDDHIMFLIDYAAYRYNNTESKEMPRHIQWRLHNFLIKEGG